MSQALAKIVAFGAIAVFVMGAFIAGLVLLSEITEALGVLLAAVLPLFALSEYGFMSRARVQPRTWILVVAGIWALFGGLLMGGVAEADRVAWAEPVAEIVKAGLVLGNAVFWVLVGAVVVFEVGRRTYRLFKGK